MALPSEIAAKIRKYGKIFVIVRLYRTVSITHAKGMGKSLMHAEFKCSPVQLNWYKNC